MSVLIIDYSARESKKNAIPTLATETLEKSAEVDELLLVMPSSLFTNSF
jgi:hypothetical protein